MIERRESEGVRLSYAELQIQLDRSRRQYLELTEAIVDDKKIRLLVFKYKRNALRLLIRIADREEISLPDLLGQMRLEMEENGHDEEAT